MNNYILSRDEILDAIRRIHDYAYPPHAATPGDGTYRIIPTWVGSTRVWMAERIIETDGWEVAYASVLDGRYWYPLSEARFGYWADPATGVEYLDQTVHIRGNYNVAHTMGAYYAQVAIWNWADSTVETTNAIEGI